MAWWQGGAARPAAHLVLGITAAALRGPVDRWRGSIQVADGAAEFDYLVPMPCGDGSIRCRVVTHGGLSVDLRGGTWKSRIR
jgi:hypothetical protein